MSFPMALPFPTTAPPTNRWTRAEALQKLVAVLPIAGLFVLAAAGAWSSRWDHMRSFAVGSVVWAALGGALAALLAVTLLRRRGHALRVPPVATLAVSVGNLGLGGVVAVLLRTGFGGIPIEAATALTFSFLTIALALCALAWISSDPVGTRVGLAARASALANGVIATVVSVWFLFSSLGGILR